jgi:gliding motility-associated-like protein
MVVWLEPTGYDNCSDVSVEQTVGLYSGSNFQLGENEVVYTFTDEAGNTAEWGFTITVIDDIQPAIITCPEDIVTCDPVVSWEEPEASDTCSPVDIVQVEGMPSGSEFTLGVHEIVYEIIDESGNTSICSFTVEVLPDPDATWGTPGTLCSNMRPLDLSDFVLGDDGGVFEGVGMNGMMFDPGAVTAGFHEVTYSVSNQACSASWTELIEVVEAVEVISSSEHEFCGLHGGLRVTVSSGQGIWTGPEGAVFDPSPMANDVTVTVPDYGDHIFTYTVEGSEICGAELSIETTFFEPPSDAIAGNDQVLFAEYETSMQANEPEVGEGTWELIEGNALVQDELDPESAISQLALGENIFTWEIHNGVCEASVDTVVIFVQDLIFPTGISPNNDGDNDFLVIKGIEGMQNSITIFDRWGKQIYQADDYQNDWGGTTRKGKPLPEDTYIYVVDTPIKQFSGYLVIKR